MSYDQPSDFLPSLADAFEAGAIRYFWPLAVILLLLTIEYNGVGLVPPEHYQKFAQHPFVTRDDIAPMNEWQDSILLPLAAFWMGATGRVSFNALCVGMLLIGYAIFLAASKRRTGQPEALLLFILLLGHPVTAILWMWIGMPDAFSFICVVLALFVRSRLLLLLLAAVSMLNHPAGVIAMGNVVMLRLAAREDKITLIHCGLVLAGGLIGGVAVHVFTDYHHILVRSRLEYALGMSVEHWLQFNLSMLPSALFSFQQTVWFVLAILVLMVARKDPMYFRLFGAILIVSYGITFFTLDTTRVFVLLTWGATFHAISHGLALNRRDYRGLDAKTVLGAIEAFAITGLLIPRFYIWGGKIFRTPFDTTVEMIRHIF